MVKKAKYLPSRHKKTFPGVVVSASLSDKDRPDAALQLTFVREGGCRAELPSESENHVLLWLKTHRWALRKEGTVAIGERVRES